jgi:hypothetical protein
LLLFGFTLFGLTLFGFLIKKNLVGQELGNFLAATVLQKYTNRDSVFIGFPDVEPALRSGF